MTLIMMDGFDAGDHLIKWNTSAAGNVIADTPFGTGLSYSMVSTGTVLKKNFTATAKVTLGFHMKILAVPGSASALLHIWGDTGATEHLILRWDSGGTTLSLLRSTTVIATSSITLPAPTVWNHVEVQASVNDTTGTCIVKVNGVVAINFTGDTKNAGTSTNIDAISFTRNATDTEIDNVYLLDATDATATQGAPNNDFLGDVRCITLVPNAAGTSTQFTPSTGANYTCVDELPYSATDYVTGTTTQRDTYATTDLAAGYTILAVQQNVIAKKNDAGALSMKTTARSGGSYYQGVDEPLATGDVTYRTIRCVDPATSALWTLTNLNNAEFGAEVV